MVGKPGPTMLPVVEKDKLVGVVTKADFLFLVDSKKSLESIMQKDIHAVSPEDRIVHARRVMIDENVARIPVVDQGKLFGIISDIEIAFAFAKLKKSFSLGLSKYSIIGSIIGFIKIITKIDLQFKSKITFVDNS